MSTAAMITGLLSAVLALTLGWRSLRSHGQDRNKLITNALIWAAIITLLALFISQYRR